MSCHCKADSWRRCRPLFLGTTALIAPGIASAQIFYSPTSIAVPVMGSYALLALCVVLLAIALRSGALRQGGVNGFFLLCLAGALLSGGSGVRLLQHAHADGGNGGGGGAVLGFIDSPVGGSVPISTGALNIFENTSGVPQRIDDVVLPGGCTNPDSGAIDGAPRCDAGDRVPTGTGGMCYTDCR